MARNWRKNGGVFQDNMENDIQLLVHPNIPKPLHGLSPRTIMGEDWWNQQRKVAYKQAGYRCQACGMSSKFPLEAHEIYKIDHFLGEATFIRIVALCRDCHSYIHSGLLGTKLRKGKITVEEYNRITTRGNTLLDIAGIKAEPYLGPTPSWTKWRLIFNGKKYKPIHKSFEEWRAHYDTQGMDR